MKIIRFNEVKEEVLEKAKTQRDAEGNPYHMTPSLIKSISDYFNKMDLRYDIDSASMYCKSSRVEYPSSGPIKVDIDDAILRFSCYFLDQVQRVNNGYKIELAY